MGAPSGPELTPMYGPGGRVSRYRVELPRAGIVETSAGRYEATPYAERRRGLGGFALDLKDLVIGRSMANARLAHERLSKKVALAVFSSDAISSTAYGPQEVLLILVLAGAGALTYSLPIVLAIVGLLAVVVVSYSQTIRAYPHGGGAYTVALENLGRGAGLVAAAALLIDYTLTVSVSVAASVEAIVAAFPAMQGTSVLLAAAMVALIATMNLRGVRESGTVFAIPTYGFIVVLGTTIVVGIGKVLLSDSPNLFAAGVPDRPLPEQTEALSLFLVLRAFAAGCSALTGVEAVSNGVQAFRPPEWRNAIQTMVTMAIILGSLLLGTTLLARHFGVVYLEGDHATVLAQLGERVFGRGAMFYALQGFTAGILFLAANTSFADYPRLAAILARDSYLPRVFRQRGNRLVFSYGILALATMSIVLLVLFGAKTTRLIPLYAFGVFLSFTLSQAGMVVHWYRLRERGWRASMVVNGFGAVVTAVVTGIVVVTKFHEGGWMVVVAVPAGALGLWLVGRYYARLRRLLHVPAEAVFDMAPRGAGPETVLVPVQEVNLALVMALGAACERSRSVEGVHVVVDPDQPDDLDEQWAKQFPHIPLVVIDSPYRNVADPFLRYVEDRLREPPYRLVVMLPEIETRHRFERLLVNRSSEAIAKRLRGQRRVAVERYWFHPGGTGRQEGWRRKFRMFP
ncbi:APC family permease [Tepidiforma sp.]|uniref:APC family permease n=1 Tax=Tepidiforma sp. TaxID=2682230 RepID=UPI002ADD7D11|nr:APC family permease [Tepidiforma sp.]